ncbi:MAG: B12-binding domain-containing radical SAM protein [Candidatus Helarchaeota archaeon]
MEVVLASDISLMSTYSNDVYIGFLSCLPHNICPDIIYNRLCPTVPANSDGTTDLPTLALRTVESICVNAGFNVKIAHPNHLGNVINSKTKIVGVSCEDPMGIGPATSSWSSIFHGIPNNRIKFILLMDKIKELKNKYDFKVVLGGPGTWQIDEKKMRLLGIDYIFHGEGEVAIPSFFQKIINEKYGTFGYQFKAPISSEQDVLPILGPSNSRMIEISRGCGRGCQFCAPNTSGIMRKFPIEKIIADARAYLKYGINDIALQSEDTLRWGSNKNDFSINLDALLDLFQRIYDTGIKHIGITHASLINFVEQPEDIEKFTNFLRQHGTRFYGCQPGIETGSPRLIRKYMKGKCYPRSPEEWQEIVEGALKIMKENKWYPVCTLIMGLPDEEEYDTLLTLELIQRIDKYPALYIPLFFVPMTITNLRERDKFISEKMTPIQWDLLLACWKHNLKYMFDLYRLHGNPTFSQKLLIKNLLRTLKFIVLYLGPKMLKKRRIANFKKKNK